MARIINVSLNSQNWKQMTASLTDRIALLGQMCADTFVRSSIDPAPLHIVVVPEYFFRKSPAQVVSQLDKTFHGFTGVLNDSARLTQVQLDRFNGQKRKHTMYSAQEKDLIIASLRQLTATSNTLIIAGTTFWVEREPVIQPATFFRQARVSTKGVARNSCFIVHHGTLLATYHKNIDREELDTPERAMYTYAGGTSATALVVDGIHIGVEICADHGAKDLINRINAGTLHRLDVHIIVSDGVSPVQASVGTHDNGMVLHCDTSNSQIVQLGTTQISSTDGEGKASFVTMASKNSIVPLSKYIKKSVVFDMGAKPGNLYGPIRPN